jgi:hypothetical protein
VIQLIITIDEQTGAVKVEGPIQNKSLSYSMLECARDAIKDFTDKQAAAKVQPATLGDLQLLRS